VPVVSVAPAAVLAFNGSIESIFGGALLGAIIAPPLAAAIASRLPKDFHPFIGNVASMTISTAVTVPFLRLLPGFFS
jgi:MFS transporter, ENTS family, enterobactin (siderophore) exporter